MTHLIDDEIESEAQGLLASHHLKVTAPRIAVLDVLLDAQIPLALQDILKKCSKISLVSVYRTLSLLVQKNLVHVINMGTPTVAYELSYGRRHHHHLICTRCGTLEEVEDCSLRNSHQHILARSSKFFSLSRHSLEFFGLCKTCSEPVIS